MGQVSYTQTGAAFDDDVTTMMFQVRVRDAEESDPQEKTDGEPNGQVKRTNRMQFRVSVSGVVRDGVAVGTESTKWLSAKDADVANFNAGDQLKMLALMEKMALEALTVLNLN